MPAKEAVGERAVPRRRRRDVSLDVLRGWLTLCVCAIHAKLGMGSFIYKYIVNRAVPMFVFLIGVNGVRDSERSSRDFLTHSVQRIRRLLFPYWFSTALFHITGAYRKMAYLAALEEGPWWAVLPRRNVWAHRVYKVFGYAPLFGASWFVTLAVLLTPFPSILASLPSWERPAENTAEKELLRTNPVLCSTIGMATTALAAKYIDWGHSTMRFLGFNRSAFDVYLFPLLYFGPLVCGSCLGLTDDEELHSYSGDVSLVTSLSTVYATGVFVHTKYAGPFHSFEDSHAMQALLRALDVPLSVLCYFASRAISTALGEDSAVVTAFSAVGKRSWNIYLGHIVLLNIFFGKRMMKMKPLYLMGIYVCGGLCFDSVYTRIILQGTKILRHDSFV